jgi:hypothetical protein
VIRDRLVTITFLAVLLLDFSEAVAERFYSHGTKGLRHLQRGKSLRESYLNRFVC